MSLPDITSRDAWLAARSDLLRREKEFTRQHDALNADRRRLPIVLVDKPYVFDGPDGQAGLLDMFGGHRQLIIQHFMFHPDWQDGCSGCTAAADELAPATVAHLHARDTAFALVSRAPLAKLDAYRQRRGWTMPWHSSFRTDFNHDFHVTVDDSELPAVSCFLRDRDRVFHTLLHHRPGHRVSRRRVHLPRPDRPRPPRGMGRARGPSWPSTPGRPQLHRMITPRR